MNRDTYSDLITVDELCDMLAIGKNTAYNLLNTKNAADIRVFELLSEKFKLFDGVFGASDEVLGAREYHRDEFV